MSNKTEMSRARRLVRLSDQLERVNSARCVRLAGWINDLEIEISELNELGSSPSITMGFFPDLLLRRQLRGKAELKRLSGEQTSAEIERATRERQKEHLEESLAKLQDEDSKRRQEECTNEWAAAHSQRNTSLPQE